MSLIGTWVMEKHEHFDTYMKEGGVPEDVVNKVTALKPTMTLTQNGDTYTLTRKGTYKEEPPMAFKNGQEVHGKGLLLLSFFIRLQQKPLEYFNYFYFFHKKIGMKNQQRLW